MILANVSSEDRSNILIDEIAPARRISRRISRRRGEKYIIGMRVEREWTRGDDH